MTNLQKIISVAALAAASTVLAQTMPVTTKASTDQDGQGVIGKRYLGASFSVQDIKDLKDDAYGSAVYVNLPIIKGIDLDAGYSYSWLNSNYGTPVSIHQHYNDVGSSVTLYNTIEDGVKPFVSAGLGYSWYLASAPFGGRYNDDYATWNLEVGAEFPYKWISVTPTISYDDDFQTSYKSTQALVYDVKVNSWVTSKIAVYTYLSYTDVSHSSASSWNYGLGVKVKL